VRSSRKACLELANALARDAEIVANLFQRLRRLAVEAEAAQQHVLHPRVQPFECTRQILGARVNRVRTVR